MEVRKGERTMAWVATKVSLLISYKGTICYSAREIELRVADGRENAVDALKEFVFARVQDAIGSDVLHAGDHVSITVDADI